MSYRGPFVGELGDLGGIVECVWASGLGLANAHSGGAHPATADERERLRVAGGGSDHAGASLGQLATGLRVRYGITDAIETVAWTAIANGLAAGRAFVVRGNYQSLPLHFRRWQPAGTFSHAVYVGPNDALSAWWVDPLERPAPPKGEPIPLATLRAFCATDGNDALGLAEYVAPAPVAAPAYLGPRPAGAGGWLKVDGDIFGYGVHLGIITSRTSLANRHFSAWATAPREKFWHLSRQRIYGVLGPAYAGKWIGGGNVHFHPA